MGSAPKGLMACAAAAALLLSSCGGGTPEESASAGPTPSSSTTEPFSLAPTASPKELATSTAAASSSSTAKPSSSATSAKPTAPKAPSDLAKAGPQGQQYSPSLSKSLAESLGSGFFPVSGETMKETMTKQTFVPVYEGAEVEPAECRPALDLLQGKDPASGYYFGAAKPTAGVMVTGRGGVKPGSLLADYKKLLDKCRLVTVTYENEVTELRPTYQIVNWSGTDVLRARMDIVQRTETSTKDKRIFLWVAADDFSSFTIRSQSWIEDPDAQEALEASFRSVRK